MSAQAAPPVTRSVEYEKALFGLYQRLCNDTKCDKSGAVSGRYKITGSRPNGLISRVVLPNDSKHSRAIVTPKSLLPGPIPGSIGEQMGFFNEFVLKVWDKPFTPPPLIPDEFLYDYTVNVTNGTSEIFTEIDIFYNRTDAPGVVFLQQANVVPGELHTYDLGPCWEMKSYVIGCFIGVELLAWLPDSGNMTPDMASQLKPSDTFRCADSWRIG